MITFKRKCRHCGKEYVKNNEFIDMRWSASKYCSFECANAVNKAKKLKKLVKKTSRKRHFGTPQTHFKNGHYENSKGSMYFRSSWEANYALYLDFLVEQYEIRSWDYEVESFVFEKIRHGTTRYLPDFKITNIDGSIEFFEVKGYMDSRSKTKLKRMKKYYPDVKLTLIDSELYNDIKKKLGKMLKFY